MKRLSNPGGTVKTMHVHPEELAGLPQHIAEPLRKIPHGVSLSQLIRDYTAWHVFLTGQQPVTPALDLDVARTMIDKPIWMQLLESEKVKEANEWAKRHPEEMISYYEQ